MPVRRSSLLLVLLLSFLAETSSKEVEKWTPETDLAMAVVHGDAERVQELIAAGAVINQVDSMGRTALM